ELNDEHIDVLREIGNIGAGNAATSLGVLLDSDVRIDIPKVRIEDYGNVITAVGGPEERIVAVLVHFNGEAEGVVLFVLSMKDANELMDVLIGGEAPLAPGFDEIDEIKVSAVKEIGNILGSAYLGSVATLTGLRLDISVPHIAIDMTGAILSALVVEYGAEDSKVMFIEEHFSFGKRRLNSHVIMFTDIRSLRKIMGRLRIDI
ncbi:MAG: chemotaxis protein CheC, partial [Clostridiales Family XIII bacterium]|nr:chemotaxis protein CheC [Clostridiales Family XIII bacterium]